MGGHIHVPFAQWGQDARPPCQEKEDMSEMGTQYRSQQPGLGQV